MSLNHPKGVKPHPILRTIATSGCRHATSYIEDDRNIWMQTLFSEGFHFLSLLDGIGYNKGIDRLKPIIDPSVLFSIARRIYESVIAFELLFIIPNSEDKRTILYNLFMAHGLSERLKNLDEKMRSHNPERVAEEQKDIDECLKEIESTELYSKLDQQTKNIIHNAFGKKFRYIFKEDNSLEFVNYDDADNLLRIKNDILKGTYSYFSLHILVFMAIRHTYLFSNFVTLSRTTIVQTHLLWLHMLHNVYWRS